MSVDDSPSSARWELRDGFQSVPLERLPFVLRHLKDEEVEALLAAMPEATPAQRTRRESVRIELEARRRRAEQFRSGVR